ncbi:MAG: hypothetical protein WCL54_09140 [Clostridia bacterium]
MLFSSDAITVSKSGLKPCSGGCEHEPAPVPVRATSLAHWPSHLALHLAELGLTQLAQPSRYAQTPTTSQHVSVQH